MRLRRCWGWAAALSILFQALLPAYAAAAGARPGPDAAPPSAERLVAICTGNGVIWVALDENGRPGTPKPAPAKPCHFCPCHATALVLPKSPPLATLGRRVEAPLPYRGAGTALGAVSLLPRAIRAPPVTL